MLKELKNWKTDVPSGLVVFLVAIPLCLGISLASGAPAISGVIAGIIGGILVTLFSNSSLGVSGPAAGLVAIVEPAIVHLGFQNFLFAVVLAGVIQFSLGYFRAGTIGYYFPSAVIKGMLVAIGLIIILKQIPHAFGRDKDYEGDLAFQQPDGQNTFTELFHTFTDVVHAVQAGTLPSMIISAVCLAILILWETNSMKRFSFTKIIQGPLVAVVAGVLLFLAFGTTERLKIAPEHLVTLPTNVEITTPRFDPSVISQSKRYEDKRESVPEHADRDSREQSEVATESTAKEPIATSNGVSFVPAVWSILLTGLTLAVVASLESLLCAEATDKLDPQRRQTDLNQELRAQGIGNFVSGLIGGLPVTQVIVRSSTNIQSGAQSRLAAFIHGIFLLVCVLAIPHVLNMIPLASLAAILLVVGYKLAHPSKFIAMYKLGMTQFLPFIITIGAIISTDLLIGIGIGLIVSLFFILKDSYVKSVWMSCTEESGRKVYLMTLAERVFFINKGHIQAVLQSVEPGSKLIIDASDTVRIDQDVTDLINDFETNAPFQNIEVERKDFIKEAKKGSDPARIKRLEEVPE